MNKPHISAPLLWYFRRIANGYFRRHFRAVRVSHAERFRSLQQGPLIVYGNHSSWWDPMVSVLLAERLMPARQHYAPMDAEALERYGILKHIGIFGVDMHSIRGAARFLRTGLDLLAAGGVLWVTPQGRFVDVRERPLVFKPGLASLASKVPGGCTVLPLAIEYTFWDERLPETLLHFGEPIFVDGTIDANVEERLEAGMLEAMETLKQKAMTRDPRHFSLLKAGRAGTGGYYELGQRILAKLRGRPYQAEHTPVPAMEEVALKNLLVEPPLIETKERA
jgi:1-acyl-sn-glycerol-3-phosphate acyltransferase